MGKRKPRQRILIQTGNGVESVEADRVQEQWAVHQAPERRRGWAVTHVDTGLRLVTLTLKRDAVRVLCELAPVEMSRVERDACLEYARGRKQLPLALALKLRGAWAALFALGLQESRGGLWTLEKKKQNKTETKTKNGEAADVRMVQESESGVGSVGRGSMVSEPCSCNPTGESS